YLLKAILIDKRFIAERPSLIAATIYCLSPTFIQTSRYKYKQLYPIMNLIIEYYKNLYNYYLAIFKKYSRRENIEVALLIK
ncbi:hypothetical protein K432DRAFT_302569, partial [Lepidopterella palustris CBS 459.81]